MSTHVLITRHAEQDIREIHDWINERSSTGAKRWLKALDLVVAQLPKNAESSEKAAEADYLGVDLRQRLFKTRRGHVYRIVFVIRVDSIRLLAVRGAGQDLLQPEDIEICE